MSSDPVAQGGIEANILALEEGSQTRGVDALVQLLDLLFGSLQHDQDKYMYCRGRTVGL